MKFRKLVMCGIFTATAVLTSVSTAVSVSAAETVTGKIVALDSESDTADSQSAEKDLQETTEDSEWENRLLAVVEEDTGLNIRSEASTDAEVVGQLERGDGADIVEKGEEWTKIVSGDVEGYVKNEYCLFEDEAEAQAEEICGVQATSTTDGLRVRSEASTDSKILDVLDTGDVIAVAGSESDTEETDTADATDVSTESDENTADSADPEWIQVDYNGTTAYVSAEYVEVAVNVGEAKSMEEILQEQAKARAAAAAASQSSSVSQGSAVSASVDDVTLLAGIIQCEAGGECYEGQVAVGAVVMNRVKSGAYPNSISGVIYQSGQFTPASSGKLSSVLGSGSISSSCYQAANAAISGVDNTGGALQFHAGSGNGIVIGNHVFY